MDEFEIPITYKGLDREFSAKVLHLGYTYKIQVEVGDVVMLFEPDESRKFRAVLANLEDDIAKPVDKELIEIIAQTLDSLLGGE
jgi:hypothetical protein